MSAYDLVIRGGTIVDGSGGAVSSGDVAISGDRIVDVGTVTGSGAEEIDARGFVVTPGFVDVHTHYDGQVTWASELAPSSLHGVTTVVGGNCGVGFAPCKPESRDLLVRVMEGVEDIPGAVLNEGLPWDWESFPEFLDSLGRRRFDVDFATQIPHGPVRVYAMGRRGAEREPATAADLEVMKALVAEGLRAGALGFSTSRTLIHRLRDGQLAPTVTSGEYELKAIAGAMRETGLGVLQGVDDMTDEEESFRLWRHVAETAGRPLTISLNQRIPDNGSWKRWLERAHAHNAQSAATIRGQVVCRPIGVLMGLDLSFNPFALNPSWREFEALPLAEKVERLRRPEVRAKILAETPDDRNPQLAGFLRSLHAIYPLGDPPDYEPPAEKSIAATAARLGKDPLEHALDALLERDGHAILYSPVVNFADNSFAAIETMLNDPETILGIGDGGAHVGLISDASTTTFLLTYWTRDRKGKKLPLETAVRKLCRQTAEALGLFDRGLLRPGYKADLNVIDYDKLSLHAPYVVRDLPAGGRRLLQDADGYVATVKSGAVTYRDGRFTGTHPGRLIRGAQPAPASVTA